MVIDLESKRPVKTPMRGIARPTLVRVIDSEFIDDVPKKRSEAAEPIKDVEDINKVSKHLVDSQRYRDNLSVRIFLKNLALICVVIERA